MSQDERTGEDTLQHQRIRRFIRTGICPGLWCSVCGYAIRRLDTAAKCQDNICQNICHITCLRGEEEFFCEHTSTLRRQADITEPVEYLTADPAVGQHHSTPDADSDTDANTAAEVNDEEEGDLLPLPAHELVAIIRNLRAELRKKTALLNFFNTSSADLASDRDAVVRTLQLLDNIAATKRSIEELEVRSIATTALPHRIDGEWHRQVSSHSDVQAWWTSGRARALRSSNYDAQTPRASYSPPVTASQPATTESSQDPGPVRPTQHRPPRTLNQRQGQHGTTTSFNRRNTHRNQDQETDTAFSRPIRRPNQRRNTQGPTTKQNRPFCSNCKITGHTDDNCRQKKKCDHCHKQGHTVQECHTRLREDRQAQFFRNLAAEQAQNNTLLIQSIGRYLGPPQTQHSQVHPFTGGWFVPPNPQPTSYPAPGLWNHATTKL